MRISKKICLIQMRQTVLIHSRQQKQSVVQKKISRHSLPFVYKLTPATETPTVTKRTAEPLCAVPDADGLCTVPGGGTLTVTGYEDPRATRRALEKRIAALEAKA